VVEVPLIKERGFALDLDAVFSVWNASIKLVFLCSPNNPTGNLLDGKAIEALCDKLANKALIVVDEAYIEFARTQSMISSLERHANLVILRTLSKAYALAGARCGALIAHADIVSLLARVITPYAISTQTIESVLAYTDEPHRKASSISIETLLLERARLSEQLTRLQLIKRVWRSDSNFILVECVDADRVLRAAAGVGLIIRDTRAQPMLPKCLRISIGTPEQNDRLIRGIAHAAGAAA
jgi:histidinol-phosphate aminotransferase